MNTKLTGNTNTRVSLFLGFSLFMFGILKFIDPFKSWYAAQIRHSELPSLAYSAGIATELLIGIGFIVSRKSSLSVKMRSLLTDVSALATLAAMTVAIYVHLHPEVPAEVLPLKIKPPIIPVVFVGLAIYCLIANRSGKKLV